MDRRSFHGAAALSLAATLSACGGGGGGGVASTPPPVASPAPTPSPTPAPAPSPSTFRTAEYARSSGLELANAATAYAAGTSGRGVVAAVIDSGVNPAEIEFAGRIAPNSQDVSGARGLGDDGGHGTAVSGVLLAAKNDSGIHGMAYEATLLALRTDTPGSCTAEGDCSHADNAIARALDIAVAQGAKVTNLSLGGGSANANLRAALGRAIAAGMVVVMSAGNDAQANPSDLALIATDPLARNQVVIAGSHGTTKAISSFSNRAGTTAPVFLTALGEEVRSFDEDGRALLYSGTSFSAPFVSGAVALLAQAFPNLTGAQIVQLLLDSADDLGAPGTDAVYGRGALNIGRAFQPRGATSLAGSGVPVSLTADQAVLSPAMGDAGTKSGMGAIVLDGFSRAFAVDLARQLRHARPTSSLSASLSQPARAAHLAAGPLQVAVSIAAALGGAALRQLSLNQRDAVQARATAGMVAGRLGSSTSLALGFGQSAASLAGQLAGRAAPAFLVARDPADAVGFDRTDQSAAMLRRQFGRTGVTATAESGDGLAFREQIGVRDPYLRAPYRQFGIMADRRFGDLSLAASISRLREDGTVLGARFGSLFGGGGGSTWFADLRAEWTLGTGWNLGVATRQGWTRMDASPSVASPTLLRSNAFAVDLAKNGFALRLSQPLRVASGGFDLILPVSYDYATGAVGYDERRLSLTPSGRELDLEAGWSALLFGGRVDANLFWRRQPGHFAAAPDDRGGAIRFRAAF